MTKEEAQALVAKHGTQLEAARKAGVTRSAIQHALYGARSHSAKPTAPSASFTQAIAARSLSDFRNTFDKNTIVPKAIAVGFRKLGAGWLYESEFAKLTGLSMKDLGMFRDNYADHIVVVDSRRVWVGKAEVADAMRKML